MAIRACRIVTASFLVPGTFVTFRVFVATITNQVPRASSRNDEQLSSTVTQMGAGMDLWENVCLLPLPQKNILALYSFNQETLFAPYEEGLDQFNRALPLSTFPLPSNGTFRWVLDPTLLTVTASNGNPAHCLNDVAVSLAMNQFPPNLPFVNLHEWKEFLPFTPTTAGHWCYDVLQDAKLIPPLELYNPNLEMLKQNPEPSGPCFKQLYLPRYAFYRKLPTRSSEQGLLTIQDRLDQAYHLTREALPVPTAGPRLLLYDRTGTTRRILRNATQIQTLLEHRFHVDVDLLQGTQWESMTTAKEQFLFFQQYSAFVAPHGAHFANLLAARRGTRVVEILCSVRWDDYPVNAILSNDSDKDAWWNINGTVKLQQWFARNGQVLGQQVFHYREKEGCKKSKAESPKAYGGKPPMHISVDVEKFVGFVANRLQLVPK